MYALDVVKRLKAVDLGSQRYTLLVCLMEDHLEGVQHCVAQTEIVLRQLESVVLKLGEVKQIVDKILSHVSREDLVLQDVLRLSMEHL